MTYCVKNCLTWNRDLEKCSDYGVVWREKYPPCLDAMKAIPFLLNTLKTQKWKEQDWSRK